MPIGDCHSLTGRVLIWVLLIVPFTLSAQHRVEGVWYAENKGQWDDNISFRSLFDAGAVYFEESSLTYNIVNGNDREIIHDIKEGLAQIDLEDLVIRHHSFRIKWSGARTVKPVQEGQASVHTEHYIVGNDPANWHTGIRNYYRARYNDLYEGIDLLFYSNNSHIKYDYVVYPGADPGSIAFSIEGADSVYINEKELIAELSFTRLIEKQPYAYQVINGQRTEVACEYRITGESIHFYFPNGYNNRYQLVIDPEQIFGSFSGSTADNWGYTATYDTDGHLYGGGIVFGTGYPTIIGSYDETFNSGQIDMGISKFSPDGSDLLWSTYIGGSGNDIPHSMVVNSDDELLIYGTTSSSDFPMAGTSYDNVFDGGPTISINSGYISFIGGVDIVLCKLSSDGSDLIASTFIGGDDNDGFNLDNDTEYNYGDHARGEIVTDAFNNVYVASSTLSDDFPVTAGAFDETFNGQQDGVVFKMNENLSSMLWSTYLGGSDGDGAYSLKVTSDGKVAVTGGTSSNDMPFPAGGWMDSYQGGSTDGWIALLSATGSSVVAGSYIGTNQYDQSYFVETDETDHIYLTGQSRGSFPVTDDAYSEPNGRQFIVKLEPALDAVDYSMVFGSGGSSVNISPTALLVDGCENVYVSGWGGSTNQGYNPATGSVSGMTVTPDALDATTDGSDFYFFVLKKNGEDILYASYFGGTGPNEHVDGGTSRFDKGGTIYQAVCAGCGGSDAFPVTTGAWSETNESTNCNLGVGKIDFNLAGVYSVSDAEPDIEGCAPFTILFENLSSDAEQYLWDFGDGSTSILFEPTYTYTEAGEYTVSLVVIDSSTCNIADTSYLYVTVFADSISADFEVEEEMDCDQLIATFTNSSETLDGTTLLWVFGDGSTSTEWEPVYTYTTPGVYEVMLIITDPTSCNTSDTAFYTLGFLTEFNEGFDIATDGCLPLDVILTSEFIGADEYVWDLGDGTSATGQVINHQYTEGGIYTITLTVVFCGIAETESFPLFVEGKPIAFFDSDPAIGLINSPITFNNLSENAVTYSWNFSDGTSSIEEDATKTFTSLGGYEICLTAYNNAGCEDTYCRSIVIEYEGVIDVPSAFSPNGDGANDILYVRGFGVKEMDFRIFNRWGELVFQSNSLDDGWDGTLRGADQEVEVYVYTLTGEFDDGDKFDLQGNISLLR